MADFLREFETLYVCRLFRTVGDKDFPGPWYKRTVTGRWAEADGSAGGYRGAATQQQFRLVLERPAEVFLSLALDRDADAGPGDPDRAPSIALYVLPGPTERGRAQSIARAVCDSGPFTNMPVVSASARRLEVRDGGYAVLPTTFKAGMESPFTVTVYADYPFTFEPIA
jgi:hypothetical protein